MKFSILSMFTGAADNHWGHNVIPSLKKMQGERTMKTIQGKALIAMPVKDPGLATRVHNFNEAVFDATEDLIGDREAVIERFQPFFLNYTSLARDFEAFLKCESAADTAAKKLKADQDAAREKAREAELSQLFDDLEAAVSARRAVGHIRQLIEELRAKVVKSG